jgi:Outer membrane protein and related peptidoglycan-associated (lipo)proteins
VFVIGGVGAVYDDVIPNRYDSINALGSAGLGFVTPRLFGINLKIRGEARALADTYRSATQRGMIDARASLGLEFPFGGEQVRVVRVPQPVQVAAAPPPVVSHHTCPYVLPGTKVDQFNCPVAGQTIVLHGVHFAFNSDRLTLNAKTVLNNAVRMMNGAPKMTVEVAGHTDGIGSAAYNLKLSQKRANAVRSFLISKGISADRLTAKGYGKSEPLVSPERTNKDRAINRRVEFRVLTGG